MSDFGSNRAFTPSIQHRNPLSKSRRRIQRICLAATTALATFGVSRSAHAQTLYWDTNAATGGSSGGTTASGNWFANNWSTSSAGTAATGAWVDGNLAVFSAGTNATGNSQITLSATAAPSGINFEEGTYTLSGTGALTINGGTITNTTSGKTNAILVPIGGTSLTFANSSSGAAVLNIMAQPTFTGDLFIGPGTSFANTTRIQLDFGLANPAANINLMGSFSELGNTNTVGSYNVPNPIKLNTTNVANAESFIAGSNTRTVTYSGAISGTSNVNFAYNASGGRGTVILAAQSNYVGDTYINMANTNGMLQFGIANALPVATNVTIGGTSAGGSPSNAVGPVNLAGFSQTWASLGSITSGSVAGIFNTGGPTTLTIDGTKSTSFKGNIGNTAIVTPLTGGVNSDVTLVKNNTSSLTLTAANSYTGDTIVNGGTLRANFTAGAGSTNAISGAITVNNTGNFYTASGTRTTNTNVGGAITVNSGGNVNAGGTGIGALSVANSLNLNDGGKLTFDLNTSGDYDLISLNGNFNLDSGTTHTVNVAGTPNAGTYTLMQYLGRSWDNVNGLTLGSTPGGVFNYSLDFQDNFLFLNVVPQGPTVRWSVGSTFPVTEGAGTWQDTGGNFIDLANSNVPITWSNTGATDVIFGGDPNGFGDVVTLGTPIVVNGALRFNSIGSPYTIGDGNVTNTLTLAGDVFADTSAAINAPVIVKGSRTWTTNSGTTLTVGQAISQATGETNTLTKAGSGALAISQPMTMQQLAITGGGVELNAANLLTGVGAISIDNGAALRQMVAQDVTNNISIGAAGGQLTVVGAAGTGTYSGVITSTGQVTKNGGGTMVITNTANTIPSWRIIGFATGFQSLVAFSDTAAFGTGAVIINGGGIKPLASLNLVNNITATGAGTNPGSGNVIDIGANNVTLSGVISGSGDIHKKGAGNLTITGSNTWTGGAFQFDDTGTIIAASSNAFGTGTIAVNANSTLDVAGTLTTAMMRGTSTLHKIGAGTWIAGGVGNNTSTNNAGSSLIVEQGAVQMNSLNAFGGNANARNSDITLMPSTSLTASFFGTKAGGNLVVDNASITRPAGMGNTETVFGSFSGTDSTLTLSGSVTIRTQAIATGTSTAQILGFNVPVTVAANANVTLQDDNTGGYDENHLLGFRGTNTATAPFLIGPGATVTTVGPGQVRFGRTITQGRGIIGQATTGSESTLKVSNNTYFTDSGSAPTIIGVQSSGDVGLRIEAPMNAIYTDRNVNGDPTQPDGRTGLFGTNTTSTQEGGTPPSGFSAFGNAYTVMSTKRWNNLSTFSTGGTLTLAANDAAGATGTINSGPTAATSVKLALDNTPTSGNLVYQIQPGADGGKFANFGGLVIKRSNSGAGTVTAKVVQDGTATGVLTVNTLAIAADAGLDMTDNDLIVQNGAFTDVKNMVLSGFGNTTQIHSSTSDGSQILALFDNSLVGAGDWLGHTLSPTAIVGKYTYFGDANIDGQVTGDDYTVIDANLNTTPAVGLEWLSGDMNLDGTVTGDDYTVIDANLGLGNGNPLSPSSLSAVPEPASVAAVGMALGVLAARRRRRA